VTIESEVGKNIINTCGHIIVSKGTIQTENHLIKNVKIMGYMLAKSLLKSQLLLKVLLMDIQPLNIQQILKKLNIQQMVPKAFCPGHLQGKHSTKSAWSHHVDAYPLQIGKYS
jgi:hypothetical protein